MIKSFADRSTEKFWRTGKSRRLPPPDLREVTLRKLLILDTAADLRELQAPPGNKLEALKGNRRGQHSIWINDRFRICFVWREGNAYEVEIVDYH